MVHGANKLKGLVLKCLSQKQTKALLSQILLICEKPAQFL